MKDEIKGCEIVERAIKRYRELYLFEDVSSNAENDLNIGRIEIGTLDGLMLSPAINSTSFLCESIPHDNMIESYQLNLRSNPAKLSSKSSWGLLRGLETFSQLLFWTERANREENYFGIRSLLIDDSPRFKFRGFMLDTARHYISLKNIMKILDGMATTKLNVFHWHMVDDQSFPYESITYPKLSKLGSFRPNLVYSIEDVKSIIQYAADRGIRVLPEIDSPGHTYSMRHLQGFLTTCYNVTSGKPNGDLGPVDPTKILNYNIMAKLIKELKGVFLDSYFHAGGDEVDYDCWKSNPYVNHYMDKLNITNNYQELANIYIRKIYDIVTYYNKTMLVWQEVFDSKANLPKDAIIHIWKYRNDKSAYIAEMRNVVTSGYRALLSSCWYLNIIDYGQDWVKFYQCDPTSDLTSKKLQNLVLGGEICMWSEFVDDTNVITRSWPRSAAAAERLWSPSTKTNVNDFLYRLEQLRCRLLARQIQAEPVNGPGYC